MKNKLVFRVGLALAFCISIIGCDGELAKPEYPEYPEYPPTCEEQGLTGSYPDCISTESCSSKQEWSDFGDANSHPFEIELACLIVNHPDQQREGMSYHPVLGEIARMRARDMAEHGFYNPPHIDRHGIGPDYYICQAGYVLLTEGYCETLDPTNNTVESAAAGDGGISVSPDTVLESWLGSPPHRNHLLAKSEVFRKGTFYGIGYAEGSASSDYAHYWVFIAPQSLLKDR